MASAAWRLLEELQPGCLSEEWQEMESLRDDDERGTTLSGTCRRLLSKKTARFNDSGGNI